MSVSRIVLCAWFVAPFSLFAANQEHQAIQRDISLLGEDVKKLQSSLNDQMIAVKTMLQQVINTSDRTNNSVIVLETRFAERLQTLEKSLSGSVATLGTKVDTMADEFRGLREDVRELNSKMSRLQTKMDDVQNTVKTINAPPPPPPGGGAQGNVAPAASPDKLFADAERDRLGGKYDLALSEYQDFLKSFPKSELACEAQYNVGQILLKKDDQVNAILAFDEVLEKYDASCPKRPDAQYMKARTFAKAGQQTQAASEYRKLLKDYPGTDWSRKAAEGLKEMGMSLVPPTAKKRTK